MNILILGNESNELEELICNSILEHTKIYYCREITDVTRMIKEQKVQLLLCHLIFEDKDIENLILEVQNNCPVCTGFISYEPNYQLAINGLNSDIVQDYLVGTYTQKKVDEFIQRCRSGKRRNLIGLLQRKEKVSSKASRKYGMSFQR